LVETGEPGCRIAWTPQYPPRRCWRGSQPSLASWGSEYTGRRVFKFQQHSCPCSYIDKK
jgi:hypothetical protein